MRITEYDVIRWLHEAVKHRVDLDNDVIHVSEVTGCLRKSYYARTRAIQLTPGEAVMILGAQIHEALQEVLAGYGFTPEYEVSIKRDDVKLIGHIDAHHEEENVVLEIKTTKKIPDTPYKTHKLQAQTYGAIVNANEVYLIYISRSDGNVKVFPIKWNESILDFMLKRAKLLSECLNKRELPPAEQSYQCNYCPFKLTCRARNQYRPKQYRPRKERNRRRW